MPGSTKSPSSQHLQTRTQPLLPDANAPLAPASPDFHHAALTAMRGNTQWAGNIGLNDILLTLCLLDHDLRYLTLERISDVVAAGLQLQREKEDREFQRAQRRRATRGQVAP